MDHIDREILQILQHNARASLKMIAEKGRFGFFAYYCWIVGALTLVMTLVQN